MEKKGETFLLCSGTYERSLDNKNRLLLPKAVRRTLNENSSLFLTPGTTENCLELHPLESLEPLVQRVSEMNVGNRDRQAFLRLLLSRTEQCELDSQFRIRIPSRLADNAIDKNQTVIVGVGNHWEIWDATRWNDYIARHEMEFERIAETLLGQNEDNQPPKTVPK